MSERPAERSFSPALFGFLRELREHNEREWFKANKQRYEAAVLEPALAFVDGFAARLAQISPHLVADARPVGGSLFRIYRDTRFGKDKTPYKSHTGIQFRHERAKDVHAPMLYLHLEPRAVFAAAGMWRPDGATLGQVRDAIVAHPDAWQTAVAKTTDSGHLTLRGDTLKRAPAGYDAAHPLIEDIRRKDFVVSAELTEKTVTSAGFADELARTFARSAPLMRFLCDATGVRF
jgi:uncharacterized protein (TIGR02453 family)